MPPSTSANPPRARWNRHGLEAAASTLVAALVLFAAATPALKPWAVIERWADLGRLTPLGAGAALLLVLVAAWPRRHGPPPSAARVLAALAAPFLFNLLLVLPTTPLCAALGAWGAPPAAAPWVGRALILVAFNELLMLALALALERPWPRAPRLHLTLVFAAVLAAVSPLLADAGTRSSIVALPALLRPLPVVIAGGLAQAALWGETFLATGLLLDGLRQRAADERGAARHWHGGLARGGIYGGLFLLLVQCGALLWSAPALVDFVADHPVGAGVLGGAPLFALAKTIVESFDGSRPFFLRLREAVTAPVNAARGVVVGGGLGWVLAQGLPAEAPGLRFCTGFAIGALAYGGVDLVADALRVVRGQRARLQWPRVYLLGALLGGAVAGALAWYFDAAQLAAVTQKFVAYGIPSFSAAGRTAASYVVYPLFSKWGAIDLGFVDGGAKLLYAESLSGVINWSIAAPLFSINLVALTALFRRSLAPLRAMVSGPGIVEVGEQTVRVLRWGLWMAPIIYSFLRLAPDPTWYNQDGAVRTLVAIVQGLVLPEADFRAWSLAVFLGLLAYDGLRILIWFDHMGLRVATLVNLSFVGGDALDERAARFLGHAARTRVIPEGIRRFLTWAPLLIPFYIPRGGEWDAVWTQSQALHGAVDAPLLPAVATLLVGYRLAALVLALGLLALGRALWRRSRGRRTPRYALGNGRYWVELAADGRGFSRCESEVREGFVLDLTRRPDEQPQCRGKFFYLRDLDADGRPAGAAWSLTPQPAGDATGFTIEQPAPRRLRLARVHADLEVEALVELDATAPLERWTLRLTNRRATPRAIELTSSQELAVGPVDQYRRSPEFAAIHVGTTFVRALGAILARNRLMRSAGDARTQRPSHEVAFHAVLPMPACGVTLVGYQDSRAAFLGRGTAARPAACAGGALRAPDDQGLLYGFDPVAALCLHVRLDPGATAEVRFVDGYAVDEASAAQRIGRAFGIALPDEAALRAVLARTRQWTRPAQAEPVRFSADGREVEAPGAALRPWTHVLANERGFGAVLGSDGAIACFAGNAQQNALTPFCIEGLPTQAPGQGVLVVDLDSGALLSPTWAPLRREPAAHTVRFGLGRARYASTLDELASELEIAVAADAPLLLQRLRLRNAGARRRRLRVVAWAEIVLGEVPIDSADRIDAERDAASGALLFRRRDQDFQRGWAFMATSLPEATVELCRARFYGDAVDVGGAHFVREGRGDAGRADDGRRVGAFAAEIVLEPGGARDVDIILGQHAERAEALAAVQRGLAPGAWDAAVAAVDAFWRTQLDVLQVETNRPDFDRLVNVWLPYQLRCSRLWARTGPNQRSGAFGFRDQLQDVLPLCFTDPPRARQQILLHAAQQFAEGDVLKWWHPASDGRTGIGVRTAASDPHLWLPYVVCAYVRATGDAAVLDAPLPFLEGRPLPRGQEGLLFAPRVAREQAPLYEHCRRAIERTLSRCGPDGVPLLGSGDWNDGLDVAGLQGRGQSVWLGLFLHGVLRDFAALAQVREGPAVADHYRREAARLARALDGWWREDGYARGSTDEGEELRLTSALMAAWPALSGAAPPERALRALQRGADALVRERRVLLLTPPFDERSQPYPGRLADYPPGVRENGGQYSHGASWLVDAWLACAREAQRSGDAASAGRCRAQAWETWLRISPLSKLDDPAYGLSPHQQPADVYDGLGHGGRGGWSWYTGAAARMLSAAYALLDLQMEGGELRVGRDAPWDGTALRLLRVRHRQREFKRP